MTTMRGLMMDAPLDLAMILRHNERLFSGKGIVSDHRTGTSRLAYGEWAVRVRRLGGLLDDLGVAPGGRVGSLAFNSADHLTLYFGVGCSGRVLHTINARLSDDELVYVANHAADEVIVVDRGLSDRLLGILHRLPTVRHVLVLDDGATPPVDPRLLDFDTLIATAAERAPVSIDERQAAAMCYTSGTTGSPKGVVYSHRSIVVHTWAVLAADGLAISESDVVMPIVPMFHAAAWGLPFAAVAAGSTLVMPGSDLSGDHLVDMIERERVTFTAGVPTVFANLAEAAVGHDLGSLRAVMSGGSAVPKSLSQRFRSVTGLPLLHAWGMTEASPMGCICHTRSDRPIASDAELDELRTSVGMPMFGIEARLADDAGSELAWDGRSVGELQIRGPWVAAEYYDDARSPASFTDDGWFRTGDVATIDADGYVRLVDRAKDLVKSGGEWISSVRLENEIMAHPSVHQAAVIAIPDETWQERPLACLVLRDGASLDAAALAAFLADRIPRWWVPDRIEIVDRIPLTATGKFSKRTLREQFGAAS